MDSIMTIGQIAGTLMLSICAALGIEWIFLAGVFRSMSAVLARNPEQQAASRPRRTAGRAPSPWL